MNVQHAELLEIDGRPALRLHIDDLDAWVFEPKRSLLEMGYVVLVDGIGASARWADRLPPITIPADDAQGRAELLLEAATDDPLVVGLARTFWNLCSGGRPFKAGPIDLAAARTKLGG